MNLLENTVSQLNKDGVNISDISRETGIHINTIYLIKQGKNTNPSWKVLQELAGYFSK